MRILLADDQEEIRMLTTHQLERTGHYVVAVSNGQEALDAISREPFDVILLDEDMPVMTGPQVLAAIRAQQKPLVPKPLIIALTGYSSDPDRERLLHVGFDSVIGKPFRMEALNDFLQSLSPPTDLPPTSERAAASPASTNTPIATLLSRVNGDETLARKMITMFLRDTAKRMAALQHALQNNDADSVASISHALQGSISIFGAASAVNYARQLQDSARVNDLPEALSLFPRLQEEIADLEANLRGYAGQKRSPGPGASSNNKRRSANSKRTPR